VGQRQTVDAAGDGLPADRREACVHRRPWVGAMTEAIGDYRCAG
jgi:hypothetical protein